MKCEVSANRDGRLLISDRILLNLLNVFESGYKIRRDSGSVSDINRLFLQVITFFILS